MSRPFHPSLQRETGPTCDEFDPAEPAFLGFLARDIEAHPGRLVPIDTGLAECLKELTAGVDADLNAPLPAEDK